MTEFLHNPLVAGALSGFVAAAWGDYLAFRTWKSFDDAKQYAWKVAAWRWLQGAVSGLVTALGISTVS